MPTPWLCQKQQGPDHNCSLAAALAELCEFVFRQIAECSRRSDDCLMFKTCLLRLDG